MTQRLPFTQAALTRAISAARKAGLRVTGIRADGTLEVQDGDNGPSVVPGHVPAVQGGAPTRSKWEDA